MNRIVAKHKVEVLITPGLSSQISLLHNQCPTGTEWSGLLAYKITKGSVDDLENLEIRCEACFPMNFGDATFTSFEGSEAWLDFFKQFPQVNPLTKDPDWFIGKIHSHHSMQAYHSPTDTTDLYENAPKLPLFLSLVVNYSCQPFAEIAISAEAEEKQVSRTKWSLKNWPKMGDSTIKKEVKKIPTTFVIPCSVVYEEEAWFIDQLTVVSKAKEAENKKKYQAPTHNPYGRGYENADAYNSYNSYASRFPAPGGLSTESDWNKSKTDDAPLSPHNHQKMLQNISELITLDYGSTLSPYNALSQVSKALEVKDRHDYVKALKYYFMDSWYETVFFNTNATEKQVINGMLLFLQNHSSAYAYGPIKEALNELKDELKILRQV
jgi:hypothetical protein